MATIASLQGCAAAHLAAFTDPASDYAFWAYDRLGSDPDRLEPVDMLAPALLDAPLRGREVIAMFQPTGAYRALRDAMQAVLDDPVCATARFEDLDLDDDDGPWGLVRAALLASDSARNIKASKVTKVLHRKRSELVPVFDSKEAEFYGTHPKKPWEYWPVFQADVRSHRDWLASLAATVTTADGRPPSVIRTADIIIWTHSQGCPGAPAGPLTAPEA